MRVRVSHQDKYLAFLHGINLFYHPFSDSFPSILDSINRVIMLGLIFAMILTLVLTPVLVYRNPGKQYWKK